MIVIDNQDLDQRETANRPSWDKIGMPPSGCRNVCADHDREATSDQGLASPITDFWFIRN